MSPAVLSNLCPAPTDTIDTIDADLLDESDELLLEEISIDGMCGVY